MNADARDLITMMVWLLIGWLAGRASRGKVRGSESWLAGWASGWRAAHYVDEVTGDDAPIYTAVETQEADRLIRETGGRP